MLWKFWRSFAPGLENQEKEVRKGSFPKEKKKISLVRIHLLTCQFKTKKSLK